MNIINYNKYSKKYTYEEIKTIFEQRGYTLISENYTHPQNKLQYICPSGHNGSIKFTNFKNNNAGCKICVVSKPRNRHGISKKREKYTIEFVKEIFEKENYVVHTTEFKNAKTQIEFTCPNNHNGSMLFYTFYINGCRCNQCKYIKMAEQFSHNIIDIKKEFDDLNFTLSTTIYNPKQPLNFICPNGHQTEMHYINWKKSNYKCHPCYLQILQKQKAFTYNQVKEIFNNKGCRLLTTNYVNAKQLLSYICPNNHITAITLDGFNRTETIVCGYCSQVYKKTIDDIKIEFENINYTLLSTEYVGAKIPLQFICNNGHEHQISWTHFDQGQRCAQCIYNRGIDECIKYFKNNNIQYELECRFQDCKNVRPLPFDIYVTNSFLIERDGRQHFEPIERFGGIDQYISQSYRDNIKNMYCINKKIPLLRISYKELKQTSLIISNFIEQLKTHDMNKPLIVFSNQDLYKNYIEFYKKYLD